MSTFGNIEVIDKDGWSKEFPLSKSLIHIGSDPGNDVVLEASRGQGVAARHLQLLCLPGHGPVPGEVGLVRIINLSGADVPLDPHSASVQAPVLRPRSATAIGDGTRLRLGGFTLIVHLTAPIAEGPPLQAVAQPAAELPAMIAVEPAANVEVATTAAVDIGLELRLPQVTLEPGEPLAGTIVVRNQGDKPGVQIQLALAGLEADCYEMGPGPILFPNAEKEVFLRLLHSNKPEPAAGARTISISATEPQAYPGQRAEVSRVLQIAPFYAQELRLETTKPGDGRMMALEIRNAGNVPSRYELRAEDADGGLRLAWLLNGAPLAAGGAAAEVEAPHPARPAEQRAGASSSAGLAQAAEGARRTARAGEAAARALGSLAALLPSPIGARLRKVSNALLQRQMRASFLARTPARLARRLTSLVPRQVRLRQVRLPQLLQMSHAAPPEWSRTPLVEPGERLTVELRATPLRRFQRREYAVSVASRSLEEGAAHPGAQCATAEKTVEIDGTWWLRLVLPVVIVLLVVAIVLGLVYGLIYGA